jgi:hypothetical protein
MQTIILSLILMGIMVVIFGSMTMAVIKFILDFKYSGTLFNGENKHIEML